MRKIAIVVVMSVIALASFGVELMSSHNDYGSLVHVAASDSCAADKARAYVRASDVDDRPGLRLFRHRPEPDGLAHRDWLERMKGDKAR